MGSLSERERERERETETETETERTQRHTDKQTTVTCKIHRMEGRRPKDFVGSLCLQFLHRLEGPGQLVHTVAPPDGVEKPRSA